MSAGVLGPEPSAVGFHASGPVHAFAVTVERRGRRGGVAAEAGRAGRRSLTECVIRSGERHDQGECTCAVSERDHEFGVYVHIPFCAARCDYCDFATWTDRSHLIDAYVDACVADLERASRRGIPARDERVLRRRHAVAAPRRPARAHPRRDRPHAPTPRSPSSAIPTASTRPSSRAYRRGGVNRLSFGVQSMSAHVLAALGRTHDPANVDARDRAARATPGFERVNVDLIYGTPGETIDDWRATLDGAIALDVAHVSAYALTVEPATPLGLRVAAGAAAPDDDVQADAYLLAETLLGAAGLEWYEVSNWARPGEECRHNLLYWSEGEYLGIGCAAHGHTGGRRWWNVRTPERYIAADRRRERSRRAGSRAPRGRGPAPRRRACSRCAPAAARRSPRRRRRSWSRARGRRVRAPGRRSRGAHRSRAGSWPPM